jgi:hypothetical protein
MLVATNPDVTAVALNYLILNFRCNIYYKIVMLIAMNPDDSISPTPLSPEWRGVSADVNVACLLVL